MEELCDTNSLLLVLPEDWGLDAEMFQDPVAGRRDSYVMERRYRHKDGRIFWARINFLLVRDPDGEADYLVGMIEDIDKQK
jgi:PAS domain S-box-containing protein